MIRAGHGHRADLSQAQQPRKVQGIAGIRLDAIPSGRVSFDGAATTHSMPTPAMHRVNPKPLGPAS